MRDDERDARVDGGSGLVGDVGDWPIRETEMLVRLRSRAVLAVGVPARGRTSSATSWYDKRPAIAASSLSRSSSSAARCALSSSSRWNI